MKVFDFTGGKKGAFLGDILRPSWFGGFLRDNKFYAVRGGRFELQFAAGRGGRAINVKEQFGVDAICFCTGEWSVGQGETEWKWVAMFSEAGFEQALDHGVVYVKGYQDVPVITVDVSGHSDVQPMFTDERRAAMKAAAILLFGEGTEFKVDHDGYFVSIIPAPGTTVANRSPI